MSALEKPRVSPPQDTSAATLPNVVLRDADTARARQAYWSAAVLCMVGAASLRLVEGPPLLGWWTSAALVVPGIVCALMAWRRRDGSLFTPVEATTLGAMLAVAGLAACAHLGPYSAAPIGLIILIIGLSMGDVARGRIFFVLISLGYGAVAALAITGVIPPISPAVKSGGATVQIGAAIAVMATIGVSYWYGLAARRTTATAVESLHRARVALAGREALLHEVQADLDRLREGRHGRLSGKRVDVYQLFELLGRGGNGEVYRGQADDSDDDVAVKVLHPHFVTDGTQVDRFFREARAAASLSSDHVVRVDELGVGPEGAPFIVMELLEGQSLSQILRGGGRMVLADAAVLATHVAAGLAAAHDAGIVHRDIKPGNLLRIDRAGRPLWKVVDFGISKLMAGSGTLTQGALIGTPGYMAPEQAGGKDLDQRADIFALGAVLYRALTGRPPFSGPDPIAVAVVTLQDQPVRPGSLTKLPEDVDLVLALALAKEPDARFPSAEELADAFNDACRSRLSDTYRDYALAYLERRPWRASAAVTPERIASGPEFVTRPLGD